MRNLILFAGAVVCVVMIYFIPTVSTPEKVSFDMIDSMEGKNVIIEGTVTEIWYPKQRYTIIKISDKGEDIDIFVKDIVKLRIGDRIRVEGRVQRYKNNLEILVSNKNRIICINTNNEHSLNLGLLCIAHEEFIGKNVNISGYVLEVRNKEITIVDNFTQPHYYLPVKVRKNLVLPLRGNKVFVIGRFLYDYRTFSYYISVENNEHMVMSYE